MSELDAVRRALEAAANECELSSVEEVRECAERIRALRAEDFVDQREATGIPTEAQAAASKYRTEQQSSQSAPHQSPAEQVPGSVSAGRSSIVLPARPERDDPSTPAPAAGPSAVEEVKNAEYTVPIRSSGGEVHWIASVPYDLAIRYAEALDRLRADNERLRDDLSKEHIAGVAQFERAERAEADNAKLKDRAEQAELDRDMWKAELGRTTKEYQATTREALRQAERAEAALRRVMDAARNHGSEMSNDEILAMLAAAKEGKRNG